MKRKDKDPTQVSATTTSACRRPAGHRREATKSGAQQAAQIRKLQEDARQAEAAAHRHRPRLRARTARNRRHRPSAWRSSKPAHQPARRKGKNRHQVRKSGVIVNFASNVVQLSAAESDDLNTKLKRFAPLSDSQKWRIHVVTPKGFSEATRLAFYRANTPVRSVTLKAGVPGG